MSSGRSRGLLGNLALAVVSLALSLALVEVVCQAFAHLYLFPRMDETMANPHFFLSRSENPALGYELTPDYELVHDGRRLHINRWGIRADTDELFEGRPKLAILGDSVTNGVGHTQERTLDRLLEARLRAAGRDVVVLNFGVPGYGTRELAEFLETRIGLYEPEHVLYLLNPNDYTRRNTVTEGADNGNYRIFVRPRWMTPWFVRKAVYRLIKQGGVPPRWYRWLYANNEPTIHEDIRRMRALCDAHGSTFSVVLLPAVEAYGPDGFSLQDLYDRMLAFLAGEGIPATAPIEAFADDPTAYLDPTDHLYDVGNERMADALAAFVLAGPSS